MASTLEEKKITCSDTKAKMFELEDALSSIIGLHDIKLQLRKWVEGILLDEKRRAIGLKILGVKTAPQKQPHMVFLGNPGTGKTKVARIISRLLHVVGILQTDKVTEVQPIDLLGESIGTTGPKTREKIREAEGGILLVDEAYKLIPTKSVDDEDYEMEALEVIMSAMDSGKVMVIFAGHSEPMNMIISSNIGFRRRVTDFFVFDDLKSEELAQIAHLKMNNQAKDASLYGFKLHPSCSVDAITKLIERETTERQKIQMNGGLVEQMLVKARTNLECRNDVDTEDKDDRLTITMDDLEAGLKALKA